MQTRLRNFRSLSLGAALVFLMACAGQQTSAPLQVPDVELSLDNTALVAAPGTMGTLTLTARPRDGFTGTVDLGIDTTGLGFTATIVPASLAIGTDASTAIVSIKIPETAASGDRALTLHATGSFGRSELPFHITVPAATLLPVYTHINSTNVNLPFMVFKDGDAPWRPLDGTSGSYQAAVTDSAGRYGLAYGYICAIGSFQSFQMNYIFQTLQESASLDVTFLCNPPPGPSPTTFSLQGQIAGQGPDAGFLVTNAGTVYFDSSASSYLTQVLKGKGDLAGWTFADPSTRLPAQLFLDRGRDAESDATRNVDFIAEGFAPGPVQQITYAPVGADETIQGAVRYFTAGGQFFELGGGVAPLSYAAFPVGQGLAGDSYSYGFGALAPDHSEVVYGGGAAMPGALSIQFPTPVQPYGVGWLQGAYARPALHWSSVVPEPRIHEFVLSQRQSLQEIYWFLYFSEGWLGTGDHAVQAPDFTGFSGWNDAWGFRPGSSVIVNMGQFGAMPGPSANAKGNVNRTGAENTWAKQQDQGKKQNNLFSLYPWPLRSGAGSVMPAPAVGQVEGRFRILGLAPPQASQSGNSFSALRQMSSTP